MMKTQRPAAPQWLLENYQRWGQRYVQRLASNPRARFTWPQLNNKTIDHRLMSLLRQMTNDHCSFCDVFQMVAEIRGTMEHFKPKAKYPSEAYQWENLFLCCDKCQNAKLELFDPDLLKPDEADYDFSRYFIFNFSSGRLVPNPTAALLDQQRAIITLTIYGLNDGERPQARKRVFASYCQSANPALNDFSYRFMFL